MAGTVVVGATAHAIGTTDSTTRMRRGTREPMPTVTFGPIEVEFDGDLLTPRPWTIEQSRWAIAVSSSVPDGPILELCSGAGHIGLVAALETGRSIVQVDDVAVACACARANALAVGIDADVRCAPIEDAIGADERFPLIIADPPYVPSTETSGHAGDPGHAIDGGADGLAVARRCVAAARRSVADGGAVIVQLGGDDQARRLAAESGFSRSEVRSFGPDRALLLLREPVPAADRA